jgi:CBS domain-containing protein
VTARQRLSRTASVGDCEGLLAFEPLLVPLDADVDEVLRRAARQPTTRLIGVVDAAGKLAGVIPIRELVERVVTLAIPEAMMVDTNDVAAVAHFGHVVGSRSAAQAMLPPAAVTQDATVVTAFREMHRRRLSGVYVVDADGRPTGYIDGLELAYLAALDDKEGEARVRAPRPPLPDLEH